MKRTSTTAAVRVNTLKAINRPPTTSTKATMMASVCQIGMPSVASICDVMSVSGAGMDPSFDWIWSAVPAMSKSFIAPEMMKIATSATRPSVKTAFIVYLPENSQTNSMRQLDRGVSVPPDALTAPISQARIGMMRTGSRQRHGLAEAAMGAARQAANARSVSHAIGRTNGAEAEVPANRPRQRSLAVQIQ